METTYETGATSHAVNDLILYTDNTRELAALRDSIYRDILKTGWFGTGPKWKRFSQLERVARKHYINTLKSFNINPTEQKEFCQLYVNDFENWKSENK
ncbi:hypothetical protein Phi46:3_gp045 [Cellulophaga phage phi46:3]|uniref:Uncharacterized protein n=1 Tax=Cellulophaga phage phi46:3 TaxID=1327985 RepID=R9ZZM8_9CAUD|nr:hypothetical protein Phi46:3_gp045 [Cellulophaga phage phi46:3]AGO48789.1 hypothetical protein Phi46:3_gp045 [Cellulophaga phage phi46:3]